MAGRLALLATLALVALPVCAAAAGVDVTVPDAYQVGASPPDLRLPADSVYRRWTHVSDGIQHSIVASASPFSGDLPKLMDAEVARVQSRNAVDVVRADAGTLCGAPATRFAYAYPNQLSFEYRYVVVSGRLLIASYAHPVGTAEDPLAVAALGTLCSGVHQPGGPPGWSLLAPFPANGSAWMGPNIVSSLFHTASAAKPGDDAQPYKGKGRIVSDRREPCGVVTIRRVTATDGARTIEYVAGILRGFSYANEYGRITAAPADPAALATLTSFCTDTAPTSAATALPRS